MAHQPRSNTVFAYTGSVTIAQVATVTAADQTFTIQGIKKNQVYAVTFDDCDAGVSWTNGWGSAADTLKIRFTNPTAGNITPGATVIRVVAL